MRLFLVYPLIIILFVLRNVSCFQFQSKPSRTSFSLLKLDSSIMNKMTAFNKIGHIQPHMNPLLQSSSLLHSTPNPIDVEPNESFNQKYLRALKFKPVTSKSIQSAIGFAIGNILAQRFLSKSVFNVGQLVLLALFGLVVHGPAGHFVYRFLQNIFPGSSRWDLMMKMAIDQFLWMPIYFTLLCSFTGILGGLSPDQIVQLIQGRIWPLLVTSWLIWPLAHMISFHAVPAKLRPVFMNVVQIIFNMFVSNALFSFAF